MSQWKYEDFQKEKLYFAKDKRHLGATYDNEWKNRKKCPRNSRPFMN